METENSVVIRTVSWRLADGTFRCDCASLGIYKDFNFDGHVMELTLFSHFECEREPSAAYTCVNNHAEMPSAAMTRGEHWCLIKGQQYKGAAYN